MVASAWSAWHRNRNFAEYRCRSLETLTFEPIYTLTDIQPCIFSHCLPLKSIWIPALVATLCWNHFCNCPSLSSVILEQNCKIRRIEGIFYDCSSLKSTSLPNSVEVVCPSCFCCCNSPSNLTPNLHTNSTLIQIGARALLGCTSLKWIYIRYSFSINPSCFDFSADLEHCFYAYLRICIEVILFFEKNCCLMRPTRLPACFKNEFAWWECRTTRGRF
jgi:hypothetical protein